MKDSIDRLAIILLNYVGSNWRDSFNSLPIEIQQGIVERIEKVATEDGINKDKLFHHFIGNSKPVKCLYFARRCVCGTIHTVAVKIVKETALLYKLEQPENQLENWTRSCYSQLHKENDKDIIFHSEQEALEWLKMCEESEV